MFLFRKYWVVLFIVGVHGAAWAQGALRDPTLPPPEVLAASGLGAAAGGSVQTAVQFVLVGPSRKYAVIDGQMLKPGAQIDQWRVANITAKGVVMQSDTGSQTISAYPAVQKNVISGAVPASRVKNRNP